jgi:hypothetical protein
MYAQLDLAGGVGSLTAVGEEDDFFIWAGCCYKGGS